MQWFNTGHKKNDTKDSTASFVHSRTRENIKSGEKHNTIFGKIARYFEDLKLVAFTGSYDDLNGKPSSMPASDVKAWAKADNKPSYNWNEIGSKPSVFNPSSHKHVKADITDFPSSMPASDVPAWAKAPAKPSYNMNEITGDLEADIIYSRDIWAHGTGTPNGSLIYNGGKIFIDFTGNAFVLGATSYTYDQIPGSNKILSTKNYRNIVFNGCSTPNYNHVGIHPYNDNTCQLGCSSSKWSDIYSTNSHISTSDKNQKKDISYIGQDSNYNNTKMDDDTLVKLILGIKPVIFTRIDADSNRPHHGLLANDFELLLKKLGIKDHAGFIKSPKQVQKETVDEKGNTTLSLETIENEYVYGFRYEELITDIIRFCQIQDDKVKKQEEKINQQQEEINSLEARLEMLEAKIK